MKVGVPVVLTALLQICFRLFLCLASYMFKAAGVHSRYKWVHQAIDDDDDDDYDDDDDDNHHVRLPSK